MPTQDFTVGQWITHAHDRFMSLNYTRYPIAIVRGRGCELYDADGRRYLDLFAGFGAGILGHCHPDLVEAVIEQARTLWHVGNLLHTQPQTLLAERIAKHGFGGRSFFCHSGADANEAAIKLARLYGKAHPGPGGVKRFKIITALGSFHGRSFGTMVATGQNKVREGFEPLLEGFSHVPFNDLEALRAAIDDQTVAVMLEPIQGEGGVNIPDDDYLLKVRRLCRERDVLLIADEVWTGCGRTGKYFAYQHWIHRRDESPDIMTLAKGVGGGLPVGVMCARPEIAELYNARTQGGVKHATTLGGNCIAMAAAHMLFQVLERDRLVDHAASLGKYALDRMRRWVREIPAVKAARGRGLFLGLEIDPNAHGAWFKAGADVVGRCLEHGLLINAAQQSILRLAPPLIIDREQLDEGLDLLESILRGSA